MSAFRALICLLLSLFAPVVAFAAERLEAVYEITWGGIEIGRFETRLTANEVVYQLTYAAQTTGFLGWLFPFTSTGSSEGIVTEHGPAPERYVGQSQRGDGIGMWAVDFGPEGGVKRVVVTMPEDEERDPVPVALQKAPDPLALALRATQAAAPGTRFEDLSFDGKRAVRFELACAQQEHLVTPDHVAVPIEHGLHCTLDGELAAGASRRWQSTRDPDNQPVRILLSREVVPGRYWPVRAEAETRFGTVIARLIWFR
jgi:Protein of unknown function (DUF3108)